MAERYRERIDNNSDIFSSTNCTTIYIVTTRLTYKILILNKQNFGFKKDLKLFN